MRRTPLALALSSALLAIPIACGSGEEKNAPHHGSSSTSGPGGGGGSGGSATASSGATGGASATGTGAGGSSASSTSSSGTGGSTPGGLFEAPNPWNTPVDQDPKDPSSDTIVQWLDANGGWGSGTMRIDFTITVLTADAATPFLDFTPTADFYDPDCDQVPFPVPANGAIEGEQGYSCTNDGDCHLLVVHPPTKTLYEMWRANINGNQFDGGCAAVWDLTKSYPPGLRGEQCSSADAGGFPIAAMLFSADEVFAGEIPHAIRFILPNSRIRNGEYVHPGSHSTFAASGGPDAPPYGVRFRLRSDFPLDTLPSEGARVIARAMQKYGMFLADGGTIALTGADDRFTTHTWAEVDVDQYSLAGIDVTDMEVVNLGSPLPFTGDCVRNP